MKKLAIVLVLMIVCQVCLAWKAFIPTNDGFKQADMTGKSINDMARELGYEPHMFYVYSDYNKKCDITGIVFKSFSNQVIFVLSEDIASDLTDQDVNSYLENFDMKKEYDHHDYENDLKEGIANHNLTYKFMSDAIGNESNDKTKIIDERYQYELTFADGYLVSYANIDYYNAYAKDFREGNPKEFEAMEYDASEYWEYNKEKVANEINEQVRCRRNIPFKSFNKYPSLNGNNIYGVYRNYKLIYVLEQLGSITLRELKDFTHGKVRRLTDEVQKNDTYGEYHVYEYKGACFAYKTDGTFIMAVMTN